MQKKSEKQDVEEQIHVPPPLSMQAQTTSQTVPSEAKAC